MKHNSAHSPCSLHVLKFFSCMTDNSLQIKNAAFGRATLSRSTPAADSALYLYFQNSKLEGGNGRVFQQNFILLLMNDLDHFSPTFSLHLPLDKLSPISGICREFVRKRPRKENPKSTIRKGPVI